MDLQTDFSEFLRTGRAPDVTLHIVLSGGVAGAPRVHAPHTPEPHVAGSPVGGLPCKQERQPGGGCDGSASSEKAGAAQDGESGAVLRTLQLHAVILLQASAWACAIVNTRAAAEVRRAPGRRGVLRGTHASMRP